MPFLCLVDRVNWRNKATFLVMSINQNKPTRLRPNYSSYDAELGHIELAILWSSLLLLLWLLQLINIVSNASYLSHHLAIILHAF